MKSLHVACCLFALTTSATAQTTWYVDVAGTPPGTGTPADPYTSIQFAIDQVTTVTGDTLRILPGTYPEIIDLSGKGLVLLGDGGSAVTTIDAGGLAPVVTIASGEPGTTTLEGLTLTNGDVNTPGGPGGGLVCIGTSPTIRACRIFENGSANTDRGGGVYLDGSDAFFDNCQIVDNIADGQGCGIYAKDSSPVFLGCLIQRNRAMLLEVHCPQGGGLFAEGGQPTLDDCQILDNAAGCGGGGTYGPCVVLNSVYGGNSGSPGGGAFGATEIADSLLEDNEAVTVAVSAFCGSGGGASNSFLARCTIRGNIACDVGGGVSGCVLEDCELVDNTVAGDFFFFGLGGGAGFSDLTRCRVTGNQALGNIGSSGDGGGLYEGTAVDCVVAGNSAQRGGGSFGTDLDNCTVADNSALESGGCDGGTISNAIVWNNAPDQVSLLTLDVTYSDVQGGFAGIGNIDADPHFWDAMLDDYHLLPGSPCIDAGDPASPLDLDLTPADMGALPFDPLYCGPGCTGRIGTPYCPATPNSSGAPADLTALGDTTLSQALLLLRVTDLPQNQNGIFIMSDVQGFVPMHGGGQGNLCLAPPIVRFPSSIQSSGILGEANLAVEVGALPQGITFQVGEAWNFQYWFRDVNPTNTTNFSNGLEVTWE